MASRIERTADIDLAVGHNIRNLRRRAKMSQQALGDSLGLTFQQVQKYEKGTNRVSASTLVIMRQVFGCPLEDFFAGIELGDTVVAMPLTEEASEVASIVNGLPEDRRKFVLAMAQAAASHL
jgi:transcriptional regulator with XRE-family HTH domain